MSDVVALSAEYEAWLGRQLPLVSADLAAKHQALTTSPLRFLRGTYYLWLADMAHLLPELVNRPLVALVGDLHVENFGTWRDLSGVRRWGVNDLDELSRSPYPIDLVRLVTSAALIPGLAVTRKQMCQIVLDHWLVAEPRSALDLTEHGAQHLHAMVPKAKSAESYYQAVIGAPVEDVPAVVRTAVGQTADAGWRPTWFARRAGTGSLGHPRLVALGPDATGTQETREAKQLGPLTREWPGLAMQIGAADERLYPRVHAALRGPDVSHRSHGWQVRRLAPDVVRIDLAGLRRGDEQRLLRSMAQACADVHGTDRAAFEQARTDCATLGKHWLHEAVEQMTARTLAAHEDWRAAYSTR